MTGKIDHLKTIEQRLLWLSHWTVHHANHLRAKEDTIKLGGHQASCASMVSIMTALYFDVLRPEDRVAVKPHASPVFHAMQYLMGQLDVEKLQNFRGLNGTQSYPSRTKDEDDVDFSTGSVGLGVAVTSFASLIQDYLQTRPWQEQKSPQKLGRMVALVGDAELDEGNIHEALLEGWKHNLRNCWWVIDYNRQSLDAVVHEGLGLRLSQVFKTFGWDVVQVKYGALQRAAFAEAGGQHLQNWIDQCPNQLYSALTYLGGDAWRKRLLDDLGDQRDVTTLINRRDDNALSTLMQNLGGNCVASMVDAFRAIDHDRPVCFLAYTIKGWGTPLAGHKDNHGGLMSKTQMAEWQQKMGVVPGQEWQKLFPGADQPALQQFMDQTAFFKDGPRRWHDDKITVPTLAITPDREISTQTGFGKILGDIGKTDSPLAARIVTMSPDVTGTTNLGPWVNRRKLFSRLALGDTFGEHKIPSTAKWVLTPEGQHIELGIAEMNLFLLLAAAGLSHSLFGQRLLPVGTVYDPFIVRGLDALNYACYQDARFMIVGTPSGITLAPEGGAHQSISTPLIGLSQDGLAAFEPAFVDELAVIMAWAFAHMQRDGAKTPDPRTQLCDEAGGASYLRLSTRPLEQPPTRTDDAFAQNVIDGAYWWRPPGPNCELVIAYQGVVAPEAITAAGHLGQYHRDIGVLAITSADRLNFGWLAAQAARRNGARNATCHAERLLATLPRHCKIVSVIDGHPTSLSWLGGVAGHKTLPLGVSKFGQTGSIQELYRHYGIDTDAIVRAANSV